MSYFEQVVLSAHPSKVLQPQLLKSNILTSVQACESYLRSIPCVIGYPKLTQPAFLVFSGVSLYLAAQSPASGTAWISKDLVDTMIQKFMTLPPITEQFLNEHGHVAHDWRTRSSPELMSFCHNWTLGIFQAQDPYNYMRAACYEHLKCTLNIIASEVMARNAALMVEGSGIPMPSLGRFKSIVSS